MRSEDDHVMWVSLSKVLEIYGYKTFRVVVLLAKIVKYTNVGGLNHLKHNGHYLYHLL
jgi:hypothetical protein